LLNYLFNLVAIQTKYAKQLNYANKKLDKKKVYRMIK
jgi:hypothetical protein